LIIILGFGAIKNNGKMLSGQRMDEKGFVLFLVSKEH
jgi:hypothetical protein